MGISAAIRTSKERADAFTRSMFDDDQWSADEVSAFVNERRNVTVATVSPAGQPHTAVVIAASIDDEIFFTVNPRSVLARNVAANDRIALSVCDESHTVMSQGRAVRVGAAPELDALVERLAGAAAIGRFTPEGWDGDIYRIELRRLVAH